MRRVTIGSGVGPIAPAQAREAGAFGELDQRLPPVDRQVEPLVRPDQHIDPAIGLVGDGIGGGAVGQDLGQRRAQRREQRVERRPRDHAGSDIDDPRAAALMEAGQHPPALPAQHEVDPPALARLAEQRPLEGRRRDAALLQRALDQADLPGGVGVAPPVLQRAAAAHGEVRAGRRLAMARRRQDLDQLGGDALAALVDRFGLDHLAGQA